MYVLTLMRAHAGCSAKLQPVLVLLLVHSILRALLTVQPEIPSIMPKDCVRPLGLDSWTLGPWFIHSEHETVIFRGTDSEKVAELIILRMSSSQRGRW